MPEALEDLAFTIWWPHGEERMFMLVPKDKVEGRA